MGYRLGMLVFTLVLSAIVFPNVKAATSSSEDSHDHDEEHDLFERAVVYSFDEGSFTAQITPADEGVDSVDDSFAFMIMGTSSADLEGLEEAEEIAEPVWEEYSDGSEEAENLDSGVTIVPSEDTVYVVNLDSGSAEFEIEISNGGAYALFLEHGDEMSFVVVSSSGDEVEPAAEEHADEHDEDEHDEDEHDEDEDEDEEIVVTSKRWWNAVIASLVISACSLVGITLAAIPWISSKISLSHSSLIAAGALLTTTFLHIVPEAIEGLSEEISDLHTVGNRLGVALLAGMFLGILMHALLDNGTGAHSHDGMSGQSQAFTSSAVVTIGTSLQTTISASRNRKLLDVKGLSPVCWNIIIGDLIHNFADGVTIGAAFLGCSSTVGWIVTASAVLHEIPHEIADFMALINGGMSLTQAYVYNLLSALSAVWGTILVLALRGELTTAETSILLLLGGGWFICISLSELVPEALAAGKTTSTVPTRMVQVQKMASFVLGALLIGIPLIWDQHCESAHSGHDH